jgi:hypothetical protein
MPEENQTWETASTPTPELPAAPVAETPAVEPVVETPVAEAETLEAAPQLEAGDTVRESESPADAPEPVVEATEQETKDEDVEEGDTPEILALPSKSSSRRWARRQYKDAAPIRNYLDFDKPISVLGDELHSLSASRYTEHVNDIFKRHSKDLLGIPFEDVKARLQSNGTPAATPETPVSDVPVPTVEQLQEMSNEDVVQLIQKTQEQAAQKAAAEFQKQIDDLRTQFEAVNGEVRTQKESAAQAEIRGKQNELLSNVLSVVDEVIRDTGLEVQANDPPKIAGLKRAAAKFLDRQRVMAAFDEVPENVKLVSTVTEAINRREYQNAFREEDNLKVRARAAAETIKQSDEFKAILEEIEAFANQSKATSRAANPILPAPGSALGVTVKPPTTWDEAIASASA